MQMCCGIANQIGQRAWHNAHRCHHPEMACVDFEILLLRLTPDLFHCCVGFPVAFLSQPLLKYSSIVAPAPIDHTCFLSRSGSVCDIIPHGHVCSLLGSVLVSSRAAFQRWRPTPKPGPREARGAIRLLLLLN
jgi:hypothetical protein